jgi:starvation-inducible DNA-binding protein
MLEAQNEALNVSREAMSELLQARLADAIELRLAAKQALWTLKGAKFVALHDALDLLQERVDGFADDIAELNAHGVAADEGRLSALAERLAAFRSRAREAVDSARRAGDGDVAGLFEAVARQIDQDLVRLAPHLQK